MEATLRSVKRLIQTKTLRTIEEIDNITNVGAGPRGCPKHGRHPNKGQARDLPLRAISDDSNVGASLVGAQNAVGVQNK